MPTVQLQPGDDFAGAVEQLKSGSDLLLPRGAVFQVMRTPTLRRDDLRITSSGDPALPPPVVRSRGCGGLAATGRRRVVVSGIRFEGVGTPTSPGLSFMRVKDLLLDDVEITGHTFGVTLEGSARGDCADVTIRRCRIHDNFHPKRKHSSGLYASCVERLVLEHNVFDTNGWQPPGSAAPVAPTDQNHNCYLQSDNGPAVVRGNIFANGSSHGLQQRCGGLCEGNVFVDNAIHHSYGLINGAPGFPGGVSGAIRGNVYVGSRDINGSPRGWALELANVRKVVLSDVLVAHDGQGNAFAVQLNVPQRVLNAEQLVGVEDLEIGPGVFVWDWPRGAYWRNRSISAGGTGMRRLGRLVTPAKWEPPPVAADLRKVVNLPAVHALSRQTPGADTAAALIRACRVACGLAPKLPTPTPTPPPPPPAPPTVRLQLWRGAAVVNEDVTDGDRVDGRCGLVAVVSPGEGTAGGVAGVRFVIDGKLVREERTPPLSIGGDEGGGKVKAFAFPLGAFTLGVEVLDAGGTVLARRDVSLVGTEVEPPPPTPVIVPDVAGAVAAAMAARSLLPTDPIGARVKVDQVIDLLT